MKTDIVKYNNEMNEISFKGFTENDFNLFMAICARMKELGETTQQIDYSYIMELVNWDKKQRIDLFHEELKRMSDKLKAIGATIDVSPDEFVSFNLFDVFRGNRKKKILTVKVNPEFRYILNDFNKCFTRFELKEYISLDGKYSKLLYQHLKQYRTQGWWKVKIEDFRYEMAIPDTYANKHVMDKVIKPSLSVLRSCRSFKDLEVEPIQSTGRGRALTGFKFTWTAENQIRGQMSLEDYLTEQQKKKTDKPKSAPKKNQFNNYEQREYDYTELEKQLLQQQVKERDAD